MKNNKVYLLICFLLVTFVSCEKEENIINDISEKTENEFKGTRVSESIDQKKMVFELIDLLRDPKFKQTSIKLLSSGSSPEINLIPFLEQQPHGSDKAAYKSLMNTAMIAKRKSEGDNPLENLEIPEVWMQLPDTERVDYSKLLVTYNPDEDDQERMQEVIAYTLDKRPVRLNAYSLPSVPVLVLETRGQGTMPIVEKELNHQLLLAGFLIEYPTDTGEDITILEDIRLKHDGEHWTGGKAEIYAITSGIGGNNNANVHIVSLPSVNHKNTTYQTVMPILEWKNYEYQAASILFWEKDSKKSYQSLINKIIDELSSFIPSGYGGVTDIAKAIVDAIPSKAFRNDDDHVDSFNFIEKLENYPPNLYGARGNARINLRFTTIHEN